MSTPPDVISQILGNGGLLGIQQNPQVNSGLLGQFDQALAPYGGATQLGLSILANNTPKPYRTGLGTVLAQGALNSQQLAQQTAMQRFQLLNAAQDLQMKALQRQVFQQAYPAYLKALMGGQPLTGATGAEGQGAEAAASTAPQPVPAGQPDPLAMVRMGAFGAALGMPGAKELQELGKAQAQYNPGLATQMKAAESAVAQDQLLLAQAQQMQNPTLAQGAQIKLLKDLGMLNISERSGNVTTLGGLRPGDLGMSNLNPAEGTQVIGGRLTNIPGATQAEGERAAAKAIGEAAGKPAEITDPTSGAKYIAPLSGVLGYGRAASTAPATGTPAAPAGGAQAALGPQQERFLQGRGTQAADYLTASQQSAEVARDTNYSLDQMLDAAKSVQLGAGAPTRMFAEKWLSGLGQQFGIEPSKELTSYTELEKYANKVAFAATRQMGAREAAQIVQLQIESNPNKSMTPDAFKVVANSMKAMNNYIIDKNVVLQRAGQNAQATAAQWTQRIDPRVWAISLSPEMGQKWARTLGKEAILAAYPFMQPAERQALLANIPADVRKEWLPQ